MRNSKTTVYLGTSRARGHLFTNRKGVLPLDLVKSSSREIRIYTFSIVLIFDRHLGSAAAEMPIKFQRVAIILASILAASKRWSLEIHILIPRFTGRVITYPCLIYSQSCFKSGPCCVAQKKLNAILITPASLLVSMATMTPASTSLVTLQVKRCVLRSKDSRWAKILSQLTIPLRATRTDHEAVSILILRGNISDYVTKKRNFSYEKYPNAFCRWVPIITVMLFTPNEKTMLFLKILRSLILNLYDNSIINFVGYLLWAHD